MAFPLFQDAPDPLWNSLYRDESNPDAVIGRIAVDYAVEVKDVDRIEEFTFATIVMEGVEHRIALRAFPGVYAINVKSEDAQALEKRLREELSKGK